MIEIKDVAVTYGASAHTHTVYVGYTLEGYLGAVARDHRKARGMSQQEVADKAGVGYAFVNRMEQGKFQSLKKYLHVLRAIDEKLAEGFSLEFVPKDPPKEGEPKK